MLCDTSQGVPGVSQVWDGVGARARSLFRDGEGTLGEALTLLGGQVSHGYSLPLPTALVREGFLDVLSYWVSLEHLVFGAQYVPRTPIASSGPVDLGIVVSTRWDRVEGGTVHRPSGNPTSGGSLKLVCHDVLVDWQRSVKGETQRFLDPTVLQVVVGVGQSLRPGTVLVREEGDMLFQSAPVLSARSVRLHQEEVIVEQQEVIGYLGVRTSQTNGVDRVTHGVRRLLIEGVRDVAETLEVDGGITDQPQVTHVRIVLLYRAESVPEFLGGTGRLVRHHDVHQLYQNPPG